MTFRIGSTVVLKWNGRNPYRTTIDSIYAGHVYAGGLVFDLNGHCLTICNSNYRIVEVLS